MQFIAVERIAAEEIISDRLMQSTDYEKGRALSEVLQHIDLPVNLGPRLSLFRHKDGLFFLATSDKSPDFVIFDGDTCGLFGKPHSSAEMLLFFQKVLRFATKTWGNLRLSITERPILNSSKTIIFPYPISQHTSFRISVELAPDAKRQAKRPAEGRSLLVYRSGTDEGGGPNEEVSLTNFKRFLEARQSIKTLAAVPISMPDTKITALKVTSLQQPSISSQPISRL